MNINRRQFLGLGAATLFSACAGEGAPGSVMSDGSTADASMGDVGIEDVSASEDLQTPGASADITMQPDETAEVEEDIAVEECVGLTRAEVAIALAYLAQDVFEVECADDNVVTFPDVPENHPAYDHIE
ncbi:hypothetical protein JKY72_03795, partial [Candidatus Gracilibacteria bacterium]|nr:hypothetical protein [Candidatus Gracilibacteria bacterium]